MEIELFRKYRDNLQEYNNLQIQINKCHKKSTELEEEIVLALFNKLNKDLGGELEFDNMSYYLQLENRDYETKIFLGKVGVVEIIDSFDGALFYSVTKGNYGTVLGSGLTYEQMIEFVKKQLEK